MNKQIIIGVMAVILIGGGAYYFTSSKTNVASNGHMEGNSTVDESKPHDH